MIRVLFVCLGNICRSPMAEAVFRQLVRNEQLEREILVDSAGTGHWHVGRPPHEGTRAILHKYRIDDAGIKARQMTSEDFNRFDYIVAMDEQNLADIGRLAGSKDHLFICRLLDFLPGSTVKNVPDPYYSGNFEEVYRLVDTACRGLLEHMKPKIAYR